MVEQDTFCAVCLRLMLDGQITVSYADSASAPLRPATFYIQAYKAQKFETFSGRVYLFAKTMAHGEYRCIVHLESA